MNTMPASSSTRAISSGVASITTPRLSSTSALPQREVKEGFETFAFAMKDGRMIVGTIVAGTTERFTVRDAGGSEHALTAEQVAERKMIGSLMPAGFVDQLPRKDLRDLFRFLSELGKAR